MTTGILTDMRQENIFNKPRSTVNIFEHLLAHIHDLFNEYQNGKRQDVFAPDMHKYIYLCNLC